MRKTTRPLTLWMVLLLTMASILTWSTTSWTQQTECAEACGPAVNAAADALCRRARAAELRLDEEVLPDLAAAQTQRDVCEGRLAQLMEHPPTQPQPWRAPLWLRLALDVGIGATATGTGALAASGAPAEFVVGFAVASVAALVGRIVLEVLR